MQPLALGALSPTAATCGTDAEDGECCFWERVPRPRESQKESLLDTGLAAESRSIRRVQPVTTRHSAYWMISSRSLSSVHRAAAAPRENINGERARTRDR